MLCGAEWCNEAFVFAALLLALLPMTEGVSLDAFTGGTLPWISTPPAGVLKLAPVQLTALTETHLPQGLLPHKGPRAGRPCARVEHEVVSHTDDATLGSSAFVVLFAVGAFL